MKKKIIALAAALMMFAGVVSASSINGDYKGNPIVKVTSNGKQLETDEVPAQIYDGHTVVPISLLRQLGASVTWDANTYSVDVKLPAQNGSAIDESSDYQDFISALGNELPRDYVKNISIDILPNGTYLHILYSPPIGESYDKSLNTILDFSGYTTVLKSKISGTIIDLVSGKGNNVDVRFKIQHKDAEDYVNQNINKNQFIQKWETTNNIPSNK